MKKTVKALSLILSLLIAAGCAFVLSGLAVAEQSDIFIYRLEGNDAVLTGIASGAYGEITVPDTLGDKPVTMIDGAFKHTANITSVILPDSITSIAPESFISCPDLQSVTLPAGLVRIGESAFCGCVNLTEISIPDAVTNIEPYAFAWCEKLSYVKLPANILRIYTGVFNGCSALEGIDIPESVTFIEQDALTGTAFYNNAENWDNGVLYAGKHLIKAKTTVSGRCELREDTKSVSNRAFSGCANLTEVVIFGDLKAIGEAAFFNCSGLKDVYFSKSIDYRSSIRIEKNNYQLTNVASWHYDYDPDVKEYAPGDINGDDAVNNKDLLRLFKYLSDWQVDVEATVLDVNGDGSVDNKDLTRLFQYLSGWDVKIYSKNVGGTVDDGDNGPIIIFD